MNEVADYYVSVVTIILNEKDAAIMDNILKILQDYDLQIDGVDRDNGVIEATGPTGIIKDLEHIHLCEYIRTNFIYLKHVPSEAEEAERQDPV